MALNAYFDDSGSHNGSEIYTLTGVLGSTSAWDNLLQRWQLLLDRFGLIEIHMSEIINGTGSCAGRRKFERKLIHKECYDALDGINLVHVASAIVIDDWNALTDRERWRLGSPYELVFQSCLQNVVNGLKNDASRVGPVDFVFDDADNALTKLAAERFAEHKESARYEKFLGSLAFSDGVSTPALQVADLFAYHCYRYQLVRFGYRHRVDDFPLFPLHIKQLEEMGVAPRGLWDRDALHGILKEIRAQEGSL